MKIIGRLLGRGKYKIGIDIGSHSIKVAMVVGQKDGSFELKDSLSFPLLPGTIEEGRIKNEKILIDTLKSVKKTGLRGDTIAVLPSTASLVTTFELPEGVSKEQLDYFVIEEIAKKIPVSIDEVSFDYYPIEIEGKKYVTAVIGKKTIINYFLSLYEKAGIKLKSITSAYTALSNAFFVNYPDNTERCIYLVNVGYSISTFCFLKEDLMIHGRSSNLGTNRIEEYVSTILNVEPERVRDLIEGGKIDRQVIDDALKNFAGLLAEELEACSIFCEKQHSLKEGDFINVYVCGGAAELPNFIYLLSSFLPDNFKAIQFDPFRKIKVPNDIATRVTNMKSVFTIAIGASVS